MISYEEFDVIHLNHKKWLHSDFGGCRACKDGMDCSGLHLPRAQLSYARLKSVDFSGAYLSHSMFLGANLSHSSFSEAEIQGSLFNFANLCSANFMGADLRCVNFSYANLHNARFDGAVLNWQSHDLLSEILIQHAENHPARRAIAGLILVSCDWCWKKFLSLDIPGKDRRWALDILRKWSTPENPMPGDDEPYQEYQFHFGEDNDE